MQDYSERTTGTRDEHDNLVSDLYHALQSADTCDHYAMDAEAAGDERLAGFFRETQSIQTQVAERAKEMLGIVASAPEFDVGSGSGSGTTRTETVEWTETGEHSGVVFLPRPTRHAPHRRARRRSEDVGFLPCLPRATRPPRGTARLAG
jgi:hypothetical protein